MVEEMNVSKDFDEILASGDEAAIEAALADMETSGNILFGDDDEEEVEAPVVVEPIVEETNVVDPAVAEPAPESLPTETVVKQTGVREIDGKLYAEISSDNAVIESKNGKHHVPYDVLNSARQESIGIKAKFDELTQANAKLQRDFEETKQVSELYSKQLGEAGLDPRLLPEQMLNNPALMAQVKEDYPQIGELVEALASKLQQQPAQVATPQPQEQAPSVDATFQETFDQSAHLKSWMNGDEDRWQFAQQVDKKLADDPSYENKPLSERLAEVERRTMAAFGDELPVVAEKPPASLPTAQAAPIPNTPTDIGLQGSDTNPHAHILDQDAGSMTAQMENMTEAQIEALLTDASDFL
jgi:hypothetical protein